MTVTREITAKLKVSHVRPPAGEETDQVEVTLNADYTDERNKEWSPFTPFAQLKMTVTPEIAQKCFPVGRNFLLTFTPED